MRSSDHDELPTVPDQEAALAHADCSKCRFRLRRKQIEINAPLQAVIAQIAILNYTKSL